MFLSWPETQFVCIVGRMTRHRPFVILLLFLVLSLTRANQPWNKNVLKKCGGGSCGGGAGGGSCGVLGNCSGGSCGGSTNLGCCPPEPVKCCDASCPKCIGGKAPRKGTGCLAGCPLGGCCPGTCPCDDCVCCYTTKIYSTVTSTCYNEVKSVLTRTTTKIKSTTTNVTVEKIVPVTFSVDEIFLFTSTIVFTEIANRPSYTEETLQTVNIISQSTIFLTTQSLTELSTTRTALDATITTNPIINITIFISEIGYIRTVPTFIQTELFTQNITVVTGSFITDFFGFDYTTSPLETFTFSLTINATITTAYEPFTSTVPYQTRASTVVGTTTRLVITERTTQAYSTAAYTTVPGDWTYFLYGSRNATRTLIGTTLNIPNFNTTLLGTTVATENICVAVTENICPTRTQIISGTTTIFVLQTTTAETKYATSGVSTALTLIPSTLVWA